MKTAYSFEDARYAKNCISVKIPSNGDFKSTAAFVADEIKARYSQREQAYIMTKSQFRRFKLAYQQICKHHPERLYSWFVGDVLCVCCCDCGAVLQGGES